MTYAFTSGPLIHIGDLPREIANLPDPGPTPRNGNGHSKIIPMAELEKQSILSAIAEFNGDKLQAARLLGIWEDDALSQAQGLRSRSVPVVSVRF